MGTVEVSGEGGKNYCVYRLAEGEREDTFVLGMLNNNKIKNCIQPQILHQGQSTLYRYNISGMLPLYYIYQDYMSRKVFLGIIESILDALIDLEEYMITPANILWDYKSIFVDQKTNKANLVCVPENMDGQEYNIYSFFREFIFQARLDMSENGAYHSELIRFMNTSNAGSFSKEDFLVLIHRLSGANPPAGAGNVQPRPVQNGPVPVKNGDVPAAPRPVAPQPAAPRPVAPQPSAPRPMAPQQAAPRPMAPQQAAPAGPVYQQPVAQAPYAQPAGAPAPETKDEKSGKNLFGKLKGKFKGMQSSLENDGDDDDMDIPGAPAYSPRPAQSAPQPVQRQGAPVQQGVPVQQNVPVQQGAPVQQGNPVPVANKVRPQPVPAANRPNPQAAAPVANATPSPVLSPNNHTVYYEPEKDSDRRTVMLDESMIKPQGIAKLIRKKNQEEIPIKVRNGAFRIGHSTDSPLEYRITDNPYIGGFHAQILFKNEQYYLMDMNSTNGTYLEGERIYINQEKLLVSGQKIKLANEEFVFEIE